MIEAAKVNLFIPGDAGFSPVQKNVWCGVLVGSKGMLKDALETNSNGRGVGDEWYVILDWL
jgi:hypothetical protein